MTRRAVAWVALMAALGLSSCGDHTPGRPPFVFGPYPPPNPPSPATPSGPIDSLLGANRALWESRGYDSYRYRFRWLCFCTVEYVRVVDITVRNGSVVSVVDASTGQPVSEQSASNYRTIDGLFDLLREAIDRPAAFVGASFDSNLGYPVDAHIDYDAGLADEELDFRIYGLTPLRSRAVVWSGRL